MDSRKKFEELVVKERLQALIAAALEEDVGDGDATTLALVDPQVQKKAVVLAKEDLVVSGGYAAEQVFLDLDPALEIEILAEDGRRAKKGEHVLRISGSAASVLTAERTALNLMQRMSGIATLTSAFVERVAQYGTMILDTRKTTPGLRGIEKYAVWCGGGTNHRMGLFDKVMIKDNHRHLWAGQTKSLADAVTAAREIYPDLEIEIEVESLEELNDALRANPEWVLLDNMTPDLMAECVRVASGRAKLEASGGITLETVADAAASGVDAISLGCLTHSARAVDLSLEME